MSNLKYRADIDGLRAVAILPVLLFHVGYNWFSGGYVGVDVFFVISGYLITSILVNDIKNNTYSILDFYERRIRRIVPALVFVIAFIIVASPFFLPPENYSFLPKEIIGTLLFISKEGANKQVISSQADSLIKISRIWADFFPANNSNQPI